MSADLRKRPELDEWIDRLACPACLGALRIDESSVLCSRCGRVYPVEDGIPVLIAERASKTEQR